MTRIEFATVMAYIEAGLQKPLPATSAEVYFDLLGDLPLLALQTAAKRVVLEHRWATFPTVAELREAASSTLRGQVCDLMPAEAWELAWRAAGRIDLEIAGSAERALSVVPPLVVDAMRAYGLPALCYGHESVSIVRAQFLKVFEQIAARERRTALLPDAVKRSVTEIGREQQALPAPAATAIASIGRAP